MSIEAGVIVMILSGCASLTLLVGILAPPEALPVCVVIAFALSGAALVVAAQALAQGKEE